jgi:hypothetical protein
MLQEGEMMVSMSALHSLSAELHAGFLVLAFACIMIVAASQVVLRYRHRAPEKFADWASRSRVYAESAGYVAAIGGLIGLVLSAVTGMYAWPADALLESEGVRNKIMLTLFGTIMWGMVVYTRAKFGRGLWNCPVMSSVYVAFTIVAFAFVGMAGSLGAHLTVGESVLDPVWEIIGIDAGETIAIETEIAIYVAIASSIVLVTCIGVARFKGLAKLKLGPACCENFFSCEKQLVATDIPQLDEKT